MRWGRETVTWEGENVEGGWDGTNQGRKPPSLPG